MAGRKLELEATGRTLADNVKRLREAHGWTYTHLSKALEELGRPLSPLAVRRIEEGERRVDADDLMSLAVVLGVNPNALLFPHSAADDEQDGATGAGEATNAELWDWAERWGPLPAQRPEVAGVDDSVQGAARGKALYAWRAAQQGVQFHSLAAPTGIDDEAHGLLRTIRDLAAHRSQVGRLWVWKEDGHPIIEFPQEVQQLGPRIDDLTNYLGRLEKHVTNILRSPGVQQVLPRVLAALEGPADGDD